MVQSYLITFSGGGQKDVRKMTNLTLSLSIIFLYFQKSLCSGEGWIVIVDDLEDRIVEYVQFSKP